ncbi:hypothetical protein ACFXO7_36960, partial [Nocardia tengchongensis]|uniref:hypothetical protein n=1 Tax=Nocardia tengchongensis TaxID=2055889 RepID=UPI0036AEE7D9
MITPAVLTTLDNSGNNQLSDAISLSATTPVNVLSAPQRAEAKDRGPRRGKHAPLAHLAEQLTLNQRVRG